MKRNILFVGILLLLFGIMYYNNANKPPDFIWRATYSTEDKQPYGCFVLDEMLVASWEEAYCHSYDNISDLYTSDELDSSNLLVVCNSFSPSEYQVEHLLEYLENGGRAFIAAEYFSPLILDSLDLLIAKEFPFNFTIDLSNEYQTVSVDFSNASDSLTGIPISMVSAHFVEQNTSSKNIFGNLTVIARDEKDNPLIVEVVIGKGRLYACSTPMLFTNYAVLNDSINPFLRTALSPLQQKPLLRTEYYGERNNKQSKKSASLLRYLLSQPSLQ